MLTDGTSADDQLSVSELDEVDGVITSCAVAIAETGTLILDGSPGQGRIITLIPDYHLCVVFADQIVADVPEAFARLEATRPLTMISGPSATSDIELNRVEGARPAHTRGDHRAECALSPSSRTALVEARIALRQAQDGALRQAQDGALRQAQGTFRPLAKHREE